SSTFTIALNFPQPAATGEIVDFPEVKNLVGRVTEAFVAGCCLHSDMPAGTERLLRPYEHFVPIETPDDVIEV
ncbi:MAG: glycosyltransferase, partial [Gammaproteobacteria bacterium]